MEGAAEPVFPLLALPPDLADRIAYDLPLDDRRSLAATCTTLRLSGHRWFRGAVVQASSLDSWLDDLALWVEQRQVRVTYLPLGTAQQIQAGLAALPAGQVVAIPYRLESPQWADPGVLAALTALTSLVLDEQPQLSNGSVLEQVLQPLAQLRELSLFDCGVQVLPAALARCTHLISLNLDASHVAGGWQHLQPLAQLQRLWLSSTAHIPASLEWLSQLTCLNVDGSTNVLAGSRHLTALRQLLHLSMAICRLAEVPAAVSALAALSYLCLSDNGLQGGFDRLRPLTRLEHLELQRNEYTEVPMAVSALTGLVSLRLGSGLQSGWHHLCNLSRLSYLDVCDLRTSSRPEFEKARAALSHAHPAAVQRMCDTDADFTPHSFAVLREGTFAQYDALLDRHHFI